MKTMLDADAPRSVVYCAHNEHRNETHPERVLAEHDLVYIKDGSWEIEQDGVSMQVHPGDVILLTAGHHHGGSVRCADTVRTMFVHFTVADGDVCGESADESARFMIPALMHTERGSHISELFERMITAYWDKSAHAQRRADAYLTLLLSEISAEATQEKWQASASEMIKRLIMMMRAEQTRFYTVEELAKRIAVSERTLHSWFSKETGETPHAWQLRTKLEAARHIMMTDHGVRLKEVAARLGFCDEYHLSRAYKQHYGIAPCAHMKKV